MARTGAQVGLGLSLDAGPCCMVRVHVVVVGCGRVGSGLAVALRAEGHSVAIIDRNPRAFRRLPAGWSGKQVQGSGFDRDDLERAGAIEAGALAAVTSGDNTNILTVRIARETYHIPNVVARIYDPRRAEIYQRLGIPTVATVTWTIDQVRRRLLPETSVCEWRDATGTLSLMDWDLPDAWAGRSLSEVEVAGRVNLVAVTRGGVPRLDARTLVGQEGDVLHVAVAAGAEDDLRKLLSPEGGGEPEGGGGPAAGGPAAADGNGGSAPGGSARPGRTGGGDPTGGAGRAAGAGSTGGAAEDGGSGSAEDGAATPTTGSVAPGGRS